MILMVVLSVKTGMNSRKADRREGAATRLTDLDNGATVSDSDSSLR